MPFQQFVLLQELIFARWVRLSLRSRTRSWTSQLHRTSQLKGTRLRPWPSPRDRIHRGGPAPAEKQKHHKKENTAPPAFREEPLIVMRGGLVAMRSRNLPLLTKSTRGRSAVVPVESLDTPAQYMCSCTHVMCSMPSLKKCAHQLLPHGMAQCTIQLFPAHLSQLEAQVPRCPCPSSDSPFGCYVGGAFSRRIRWCACGRGAKPGASAAREGPCGGTQRSPNTHQRSGRRSSRQPGLHLAKGSKPATDRYSGNAKHSLRSSSTADAQSSKNDSAAVTTAAGVPSLCSVWFGSTSLLHGK